MKKIALLLAVLMMMSAMLVACSKNNENDDTDETKNPTIVEDETGSDTTTDTAAVEETTEEATTEAVTNPVTFTFTACEETTIYTVGNVNLRKQPTFDTNEGMKSVTDHTALVKIAESNESAIDSEKNEYKWFKVKYEDAEWYVKSTLTSSVDNPDEGFTPVEKTLYVKTDSINVRLFPNMENPAIGYLYKGDSVKIIAENTESGWYKIAFAGSTYTPAGEYYIVNDAKYFSETPIETEAAN